MSSADALMPNELLLRLLLLGLQLLLLDLLLLAVEFVGLDDGLGLVAFVLAVA